MLRILNTMDSQWLLMCPIARSEVGNCCTVIIDQFMKKLEKTLLREKHESLLRNFGPEIQYLAM